jgi:hypothetical protein
LDLGMDAFLTDMTVVAVAGLCLVALAFCMRLLTYREPRPARSAAFRAAPVGRQAPLDLAG